MNGLVPEIRCFINACTKNNNNNKKAWEMTQNGITI